MIFQALGLFRLLKILISLHLLLILVRFNIYHQLSPYMSFRRIFFLVLLVGSAISGHSVSDNESLQATWNNKDLPDSVRFQAFDQFFRLNAEAQPESLLVVADSHMELALEKKSKREEYQALFWKSRAYYLAGDYVKAEELLASAALLIPETGDPGLAIGWNLQAGNINYEQRKYKEAIQYFSDGQKAAQEQGKPGVEALFLNNLAGVYSDIEYYEPALKYLEMSRTITKQSESPQAESFYHLNIGEIKYQTGEYEEAIAALSKASPLFQSLGNQGSASYCYYLLAKCHLELEQLDEAVNMVEKCLEIDRQLGFEPNVLTDEVLLATIISKRDVDKAVAMGEELLPKVEAGEDPQLMEELYELMYKCYKEQGKLDRSLEMHELFMVYNDSNEVEKNQLALSREAIKVEYEMELQQKVEEIKEEQAKANNQWWWVIGIGGVVVLAVFLVLWRSSRKNRALRLALERELKEQRERNSSLLAASPGKGGLNRENIEASLGRSLNKTDWTVLGILHEDPLVPNKKIADLAHLSVEGISSSLRRMYTYFEIGNTKYKKLALILEATKRSSAS